MLAPFLYSLVSEFLSCLVSPQSTQSRVYSRVYTPDWTPVSHSPPTHIYRIRALPLIHSRDIYTHGTQCVVWATHTAQGGGREGIILGDIYPNKV